MDHPYRSEPLSRPRHPSPKLKGWARFRHFFERCKFRPVLIDIEPQIDYVSRISESTEQEAARSNPITRFQFFSSGDYNDGTGVECKICGRILPFETWNVEQYFKLSKITARMLVEIHRFLRERCSICGDDRHRCKHGIEEVIEKWTSGC